MTSYSLAVALIVLAAMLRIQVRKDRVGVPRAPWM